MKEGKHNGLFLFQNTVHENSFKVGQRETRLEFFFQLALEITSRRECLWTHYALGNIFYLVLSH